MFLLGLGHRQREGCVMAHAYFFHSFVYLFIFTDTFTGGWHHNERQDLPLFFQTPSLKRIYTKAHSLNLHHPGLQVCPECTRGGGRGGGGHGNKEEEDKEERRRFSTTAELRMWRSNNTQDNINMRNLWCHGFTGGVLGWNIWGCNISHIMISGTEKSRRDTRAHTLWKCSSRNPQLDHQGNLKVLWETLTLI